MLQKKKSKNPELRDKYLTSSPQIPVQPPPSLPPRRRRPAPAVAVAVILVI